MEKGGLGAALRGDRDRGYFFVQVSSSSFVHFPPISTSDMCSTFVELTFVKTSRTFIVVPPPCPIDVEPIDFGHADALIRRAEENTRAFLETRRRVVPLRPRRPAARPA